MALLRQDTQNSTRIYETLSRVDTVGSIVDYFNRQKDHTQVASAIKERYGVGIKKTYETDDDSIETYTNRGFELQVNAGMIENVSSGFGNKIVNALATLFTEPGQKFTLMHPTTEDVSAAEELLNYNRDEGGYVSTLTEADRLSIQCGSSAMLVEFSSGSLRYRVLSPGDIEVHYAERVEEDGRVRSVDKTDLEDATVVILRLGQIDMNHWTYLAIYGASTVYPMGRYVFFNGSSIAPTVPPVGDPEAMDYEIEGEIANPMSYYSMTNPDMALPEYPLAIFKGGHTDEKHVTPISTSLHSDSIEFDVASAHLLSASQNASTGTLVIKRAPEAQGQPLPRTLHGAISLNIGQDIEHISHDSKASMDGANVMQKLMVNLAAGYSVPDFMVSSEDYTVEASSGVALAIKARPLVKMRDRREALNRPAINKIFQIEKTYISLYADESEFSESEIRQLEECEQLWDAGELILPENRLEAANRVKILMDQGVMDTVEAIREYYQLATTEEAMEFYDKMKERGTEYPSLAPQQQKKLGLPSRPQATEL